MNGVTWKDFLRSFYMYCIRGFRAHGSLPLTSFHCQYFMMSNLIRSFPKLEWTERHEEIYIHCNWGFRAYDNLPLTPAKQCLPISIFHIVYLTWSGCLSEKFSRAYLNALAVSMRYMYRSAINCDQGSQSSHSQVNNSLLHLSN